MTAALLIFHCLYQNQRFSTNNGQNLHNSVAKELYSILAYGRDAGISWTVQV